MENQDKTVTNFPFHRNQKPSRYPAKSSLLMAPLISRKISHEFGACTPPIKLIFSYGYAITI